jgi:hypothetical protein
MLDAQISTSDAKRVGSIYENDLGFGKAGFGGAEGFAKKRGADAWGTGFTDLG